MADRTINVSLASGSTVTTKAVAYSGGEIKIVGTNLSPSSVTLKIIDDYLLKLKTKKLFIQNLQLIWLYGHPMFLK